MFYLKLTVRIHNFKYEKLSCLLGVFVIVNMANKFPYSPVFIMLNTRKSVWKEGVFIILNMVRRDSLGVIFILLNTGEGTQGVVYSSY